MSLSTAIYLTEFIGNIGESLAIIFWMVFCALLFCAIAYLFCLDGYADNECKYKTVYIIFLRKWWVLLIFLLIMIPIPSKNSMYLIIAAEYLSKSDIPKKVEKVLNLKLDEYINELTDKE